MTAAELLGFVDRHVSEVWPADDPIGNARALADRNGIDDEGLISILKSIVDRADIAAHPDAKPRLYALANMAMMFGIWLVEETRLRTADLEVDYWRENANAYGRILQVLAEQPDGCVVPLELLEQARASAAQIAVDVDEPAGTATVVVREVTWHPEGTP